MKLINRDFADKWLFRSLIFLVVFIPLYPKFPLIPVFGTYVAIRLEDILIAFVLMFWLLSYLPDLKVILSKTIFQSFILFWFIGFVSLLSGLLITFSVSVNLGLLHWLRRIEVMALFFVAATVVKNRNHVLSLLKTLFIVNILVVVYGFGQIFLNFPVISTTNKEFSKGIILQLTKGGRVNSTFAGHYDLAIYLSVVIVFIGTLFFYYKNLLIRFLQVIIGLLSFILLGLTAARVSFVASILGLALSFWYTGKRLLIIGIVLISIVVLAAVPQLRYRLVATITVNLLEGGGPKYTPKAGDVNLFTPDNRVSESSKSVVLQNLEKEWENATASATISSKPATTSADIAPGEPINTTELGVYRSYNIRTDVEWPRAIRAFLKNPLLGTGYSSITIATDNDYLRSLGETGLLGTAAFGLIFYILIKRFFKTLKSNDKLSKLFIISSLCMVFIILVTGTFLDALEASKIASLFWLMLGAAWAISEKELN